SGSKPINGLMNSLMNKPHTLRTLHYEILLLYRPTASQQHASPNGVDDITLRKPSTTVPTGMLSLGLQARVPRPVSVPGPVGVFTNCCTCAAGGAAAGRDVSVFSFVPWSMMSSSRLRMF